MYNQQRGPGGRIRPGQQGGMTGGDAMYNNPRAGRTGNRLGGPMGPGGDAYGYGPMGPGGAGMRMRSSTNEVYWEFSQELITYREDLSKRDKPLLVWVFDDAAEPGHTYRYRVRIGIFNPVAGTNQVADRDADKKDQVILWSPYSETTKPVDIPKMVYLFAKDVQEKSSMATVEVARYSQGYWHSQDFQVKLGETIGKVVEPKKEEDRDRKMKAKMAAMYGSGYGYPPGGDRITGAGGMPPLGPGYGMTGPDQQNVPKAVDYGTGKVLVDLIPVNDWGNAPNLRPRMYHDMLYTGDGTRIEHMPVNNANWPRDLAAAYQYIQAEKRKEPQPFRAFNKSGLRGRGRGGRGGPGMEGGAYDESGMYEDMGGAYGGYGDAYGGYGGAYP